MNYDSKAKLYNAPPLTVSVNKGFLKAKNSANPDRALQRQFYPKLEELQVP